MFHGKCVDEGDNPNIYNIKEDNRLSPGLQPLTTRNAIIILFFSVRFRNCIYYTGNVFVFVFVFVFVVVFYKTTHSSF